MASLVNKLGALFLTWHLAGYRVRELRNILSYDEYFNLCDINKTCGNC